MRGAKQKVVRSEAVLTALQILEAEGLDENGAATMPGAYGLSTSPRYQKAAKIHILPVPWEATTSDDPGTARAPRLIREQSGRIELHNERCGRFYESGIFMHSPLRFAVQNGREARRLAVPIINRGGDIGKSRTLAANLARVNKLQDGLQTAVHAWTGVQLMAGNIPIIVGGDHSVPLGAHCAAGGHRPSTGFDMLWIDSHSDLRCKKDGRPGFEGFNQSHASIAANSLMRARGLKRIVQVGIRARSRQERDYAQAHRERLTVLTWDEIAWEKATGVSWHLICKRIVSSLGRDIWLSIDMDGLSQQYCPKTGTPFPGGMDLYDLLYLIHLLVKSGRRIMGADVVETGNGKWDALVAAVLIGNISGYAAASQGLIPMPVAPIAMPN